MQKNRRIFLGIFWVIILLLASPARAIDQNSAQYQMWSRDFTIFRDGSAIGHQSIEILEEDGARVVKIETDIEISIAFITVYRRSEAQEEIWRNGQLEFFQSQIDDDGEIYHVEARRTSTGILVEGTDNTYIAPPSTLPATYWSSAFFDATHFIDVKKGRLHENTLVNLDANLSNKPSATNEGSYLRLEGEKEQEFWFDHDDYLSRTRFRARDGSLIDYRPRS